MDRHVLALFIPILALAIPVVAIIFKGIERVARIHLEEAKVRAGALPEGAESELVALREDVAALRGELSEVQERLDFTERLLTQGRNPEAR